MLDSSRRRKDLGASASAALPAVWEALRKRGWSDGRLAKEIGETSAQVARVLYGDRSASRQIAVKLHQTLGIAFDLWDLPCPVKRRAHEDASAPKLARKRKAAA